MQAFRGVASWQPATIPDAPALRRKPGRTTNKSSNWCQGTLRLNIHALYAETKGKAVDRDALEPKHFANWMDWGKAHNIHLDFNPSFFSHPKANAGYTLASTNKEIRKFWIRHAIASRKIARAMAQKQGGPCFVNHWIPDGAGKDFVADRWTHRALLTESLDQVFEKKMSGCLDYVESKLFGIGSEEYVVGSSEILRVATR
jgi:L-rhamnose isomerase